MPNAAAHFRIIAERPATEDEYFVYDEVHPLRNALGKGPTTRPVYVVTLDPGYVAIFHIRSGCYEITKTLDEPVTVTAIWTVETEADLDNLRAWARGAATPGGFKSMSETTAQPCNG